MYYINTHHKHILTIYIHIHIENISIIIYLLFTKCQTFCMYNIYLAINIISFCREEEIEAQRH